MSDDTAICKYNESPKLSKLSDTRNSIIHRFDIGGLEGYLIVGLNEDNSMRELFISISKEGSYVSGIVNAFAITFSLALQSGTPLKLLLSKLEGHQYEPFGLTSNPNIREALSLTDYISQYLRRKFL